MDKTRVNTGEFAKRDFQTSPTNHSGRRGKRVIVVHVGNEDNFVQGGPYLGQKHKNTKDDQVEINGDVL